jgi:hypothetical protein
MMFRTPGEGDCALGGLGVECPTLAMAFVCGEGHANTNDEYRIGDRMTNGKQE